jgi:hypothetical protein
VPPTELYDTSGTAAAAAAAESSSGYREVFRGTPANLCCEQFCHMFMLSGRQAGRQVGLLKTVTQNNSCPPEYIAIILIATALHCMGPVTGHRTVLKPLMREVATYTLI